MVARHVRSLPFVGVALLALGSDLTASDEPSVGTTRTLPVASVSLAVGSTEKATRRVVYSPPPGWYVRSHRVTIAEKSGIVTYAVSTVPAGWHWTTDETATHRARGSGTASASSGQVGAGAAAAGSYDAATTGRMSNSASHHALLIEVTARGAGLWQGGGGVELTVFAELVYLGK